MVDIKYSHTGTIDHRLIEECAELIKEICKTERFGYNNYHPKKPSVSNKNRILREIKDVRKLLDEMESYMQRNH